MRNLTTLSPKFSSRTHARNQPIPRFRIPWMRLHVVLISLIYLALSSNGIIEFTIWPSVQEFLGALDPYLYFEKTWDEIFLAPWGVRTGVAMPSLLLAEFTSLSQESTFGLQCAVIMVLTVVLINRSAAVHFGTRLADHELVVAFFIYGLSCSMNGRLCSAFLGSAWLMKTHLAWIRGSCGNLHALTVNVAALALMTVSSGTFMVGLATVMVWFYFALFDIRDSSAKTRLRPAMLLGMLPVFFLAAVQSSMFLTKLYDYYDGDMLEILYHGYGDYIQRYLPGMTALEFFVLVSSAVPIVGLIGFSIVRRLARADAYLFCSVALTISLGACGWSTMLTNTPAIVLSAVIFVCRPRIPERVRMARQPRLELQ